MSRSGYVDEEDYSGQFAMWRGQVASAIRGKRGQALLRDMLAAMDAMPQKKLIRNHLCDASGEVCALGALGQYRGVDLSQFERFIDTDGYCDDPGNLAEVLGNRLNAATQLVQEIQYLNDEHLDFEYVNGQRREITPEERWQKMRGWIVTNLKETTT